MAKKKITQQVEELIEGFVDEENLEIWNVEFVKEVKDWFLRVYIDTPFGSEQGISLDECEKISRYLSEKLDELDLIEQNYFLEVASPGLERELVRREHFERYVGSDIEIKLYKAVDGNKTVKGILRDIDEDVIAVECDDKTFEIPMQQIAKAKLAVFF